MNFKRLDLILTVLSRRQVFSDVLHGVLDVVLPGDVHVDQLEAGRGLDPQPLGALAPGVQAGGEHREPDRVQVTGELVADPGVATRHQDGLALCGDTNCTHNFPIFYEVQTQSAKVVVWP